MSLFDYIVRHAEAIATATGRHLELFCVSMVWSVVIGLVLGLLINLRPQGRIAQLVLNVTSAFQAVPSIAVVAGAFLFLGIGTVPAIVALAVYSLVPVVFNTVSGLGSVAPRVLVAARGIGMTPLQVLLRVQIPIALPVMMGGIRSAATINIGTATVAAIIGGGGLGDLIFAGLKLRNNEAILTGALLSALLAIVVDLVLAALERTLTSPGLRPRR